MNSPFRNLVLTFLILLSLSEKAEAQKKFKFGKIPIKDMEMTVYEPDPSAAAVVLLSTGHYRVRDYKFYKHERIKILKQSGTDYGNFTIRVPSKGNFRASCFNLENGEIVEYKLKKSEVYVEELTEDIILYKLFLPNVKVGSVVEIEYSHFSLPFEWLFQRRIPVKYNELLVEKSQYFIFDLSFFGSVPLKRLSGYHWIAQDVPAFKPEPLIDHHSNYISKIEFELSQISIPGVFYREYSTTWEKVSRTLTDNIYFGGLFRTGGLYLNEKAKEILATDSGDMSKVLSAIAYIKENIEWNGSESPYMTQMYRTNFKKDHSGNVAEVNLHLVSLLKKMEMEAYPVVLSTRDNGRLKKFKPSINKLNYIVCAVKVGEDMMLIDAAEKNLKPGVLHPKCLNGDGWVVNEKSGWWIPLEPNEVTMEKGFTQIDVSNEGIVTAKIKKSMNTYDYLRWKDNFDEFEDESKYTRWLQDRFDDIVIEDFKLTFDEDKMVASEVYDLDISSVSENLGDEYIINPFILSLDLENPFKAEERNAPVDLNYKSGMIHNILINVPDGYTISSIPEPISIATEGENAIFNFQAFASKSTVSINYQMVIKNPVIPASQYSIFKTFYSLMIDKLNESISLSKVL
ncbi:MAG: hypothetical protein ABJG41_18145 [Cyclobacteriaceae bacterium]